MRAWSDASELDFATLNLCGWSVVEQYSAEAVVMYLVSGHYRQPLAFSPAVMQQAQANVARIREAGRRLSPGPSRADLESLRDSFFDALADDFNTPQALGALNEWIADSVIGADPSGDAHLREMLGVLGLENLLDPTAEAPADVRELAERREQARAERDFGAADRLREEIAAHGWQVRDVAGGFELVPR